MTEIERAIKHFTALQKRYTTQHNGIQCELVATALSALTEQAARINPKPLVPTESRESGQWGKCPECGKVNRVYYNFCANCGIPICPPKEDKPID